MIKFQKGELPSLYGPAGSLAVKENDEITLKLAMLVEGHCEGLGSTAAAQKFGYSRQRYYQILELFKNDGAEGLKSHKTGPKSHYRRTHEVVRQVIRYRYLDPNVSPEVIAQKLNQNGFPIAMARRSWRCRWLRITANGSPCRSRTAGIRKVCEQRPVRGAFRACYSSTSASTSFASSASDSCQPR